MSGKGKINGVNPAELSTPLNNSKKGPAGKLEAGTTTDSETLQLAKNTADAVQRLHHEMQQMRADMIKNAEDFKTFMNAAMGQWELQAGLAPAAAAPAPAAPPSPAPTLPFSSALPAIDETEPTAFDKELGATAESQPLMPLRSSGGAKRPRLDANSGQDAQETLQDPSPSSAEAIENEKPAGKMLTFEDILQGCCDSGANNGNAAQKLHRCEQCGNTFSKKSHLTSHVRIHTGERRFPCDDCNEAFDNKYSLKLHMRGHIRERPYKCDICGDRFKIKATLARHMQAHTGEKPYQCAECDMKFTQKGTLSRHMRTHTGEKPYECSICGKACSQKSDLTSHMRRHHTG